MNRAEHFLERYCVVICLVLVAIGTFRIVSTYNSLALTEDEPFHLSCAIEYLSKHTITLDVENPPIAQAIEGLGPYLAGARLTGRTDPFVEGADILARSGNVGSMVFRLRLGTLPFFLLACGVVGLWAAHFFGKATAALAVAFFTLLPTSLADGGLATTDMALASTTGAAFLTAILWAENPGWVRALMMAFFMALALLSKFTALGYLTFSLGFAAVACIHCSAIDWHQWLPFVRRYYKSFAVAVVSLLLLIWAAYWFSVGWIPGHSFVVPAPEYFAGISAALAHNREGHDAFLFGHHNTSGWWYYFPVALAVKTPIAFLVFVVVGGAVCYRRRAAISYVLPFAFALGILLPAMTGHVDIGIRHIAPIYLGLSVIAAIGMLQLLTSKAIPALSSSVALGLLLWMIVSVALQHPDYLAYFNAFAGAHPENVLVDSNYDWGQDLKLLSVRLHQLGADHVALGSLDGAIRDRYREEWYGIPKILVLDDDAPSPGWTAVSASFDKSYRFRLPWRPRMESPWYERVVPTERVGPYSLYYVPPAGHSGDRP